MYPITPLRWPGAQRRRPQTPVQFQQPQRSTCRLDFLLQLAQDMAAAATPVTAPDSGEAGDAGQVHEPATIVGSCTCACPPGQGFGACFNIDQASAPLPPTPRPPPPPGGRWHRTPGPCERLPPNSSVAIALATSAATYCPDVGVAAQCKWPEEAGRDLCYADWANNHSHGLETTTLLTPCHQIAGLPPAFSVATCSRRFHAFRESQCDWSPSPCKYSPYYPPAR